MLRPPLSSPLRHWRRGAANSGPLDDPDAPVAADPIDSELPGEGPEDLSGPDDSDPLPQ